MENGSQFNHTENLHAQTIRPHKGETSKQVLMCTTFNAILV